jgi:RNA polymerase sigma-70 factor (ECF subfamily)
MVARRFAVNEDDERALVARIGGGDRAAFSEFYDRHARRVLAFVRDLVDDPAVAEEVAGDVMVAVWRGARRFRGAARVSTWVLGIAHHKAIDARRRTRAAPLPLEAVETLAADGDPADITIRAVDRATLDAALASLSPEHREVLQLMYGFERSQAEIAEITGIPVATVKTRAFYAKRRLRDALDALHAEERLA